MKRTDRVKPLLLGAVLAGGVTTQHAFAGLDTAAASRSARPSSPVGRAFDMLNFDPGSRTQRFRYDPEGSYAILGLPGVPTDIQLAPGEHVTGFALGDTVQWVVEELQGHIFVKPLRSDLFTAGTLVTDQHSYQLTLKSGHPRDEWMQRVSWTYPDLVLLRHPAIPLPHGAERIQSAGARPLSNAAREPVGLLAEGTNLAGETGAGAADGETADRGSGASTHSALTAGESSGKSIPGQSSGKWYAGLDPKYLNFAYQVSGDGNFRPIAVFDDGHAVWLRMPVQASLPALFQDSADGVQLVHYAVRGDWLVIPRLAARLILKLGRNEVRIERTAGGSRSDNREEDEHERFWR